VTREAGLAEELLEVADEVAAVVDVGVAEEGAFKPVRVLGWRCGVTTR